MKARVLRSATASLLRSTDWRRTALGPMENWPTSLRSHAAMVMEMPSPAIIFWGDEQIQIYNDGYAAIMGPRHPRYFGSPYRDCWPDTYPLIYPWMRRVLDHGEVVEVVREPISVTRYGFEEDAYFTFTFSPLRDDEGRIAGILQPVFEVTDAVLSERRTAVLAELTPDRHGARSADDVLRVLEAASEDVPSAALFLDGERPGSCDALVGVIGRLWHDTELQQVRSAAIRACATGESVLLDQPRVHVLPLPSLQERRIVGALALGINPRLHFDDKYREFQRSVARQVAGLLQKLAMQRAVERQQASLSDLFLQAPAGIALLEGPDLVFALANPLYQASVGGRIVIGRSLRELLPELQGQPFLQILADVYRTGEAYVGRGEVAQLVDEQGVLREKFFNYVYQPTRDAEGRTTGILVFFHEVTDQVRAQREAQALAEQLQLEHRRKDEFLAMLAHELRNPLAPISSAAELLRSGRADSVAVMTASATIARQVRHMAALVNDLLDVSRVTRGLVEIDRQPQAMAAVAFDAIEQVRPLMESRRHRLASRFSAHNPVVLGDRKRLVQIVANLLTNAAKYTPDGGDIALSMTTGDSHVELWISDNGIGIAPEVQPHIFELFVQAQRGADRAEGGLGIGLALVKRLTELHGGTVACESAGPGHGSRFTVRLPLVQASVLPVEPPLQAEQMSPGKRILVVDDNVDAAQMLALLLQSEGHDVAIETVAMHVLDRANRWHPQVVILDIGMPGMDGYEVAQQLRGHAATAGTVLMAVTGYGQAGDRERARRAGFDHFLVKPVDLALLATLMATMSVAARPGEGSPG
ncbi:ATP-binding protein [Roseateles cellulosilyticus]|uniref:histidine kinase n=1 Tax=Pelomonas cellulosilytica TaxID=2906762 RepID=A0ABS8XTQ6_9BURK|nr:ATP-binding protein [Pelomonas sp. P8]MCE4554680.1 ATP-binding protein [Pelomonas sp. P8]